MVEAELVNWVMFFAGERSELVRKVFRNLGVHMNLGGSDSMVGVHNSLDCLP